MNDNNTTTYFAVWQHGSSYHGNFKCTLTDNGDVIAVHSGYQWGYSAARFIRTPDKKAMRYEHIGSQYCDNCYTTPNDGNMRAVGARTVMSRNKRNVIMYGSYYYYGAGACGWIISRDFNTANGDIILNRDTSYGTQFLPWRDADFYAHHSMNWNANGNYEKGACGIIHQDGKGNFRRYSVGMMIDGPGNHTAYPYAIPFHHDGLNY